LTIAAVAATAWTAGAPPADAEPVFKVYVEHGGVYEVTFEGLVDAGLGGSLASAGIGLRNFGEPVPVWLEDGDDGVFGPGDRVLFMGSILRGEASYFDQYSRFNCYVLDFADPEPWRGDSRQAEVASEAEPALLLARHHLEPDRVMVRFRAKPGEIEEAWYWARLSVADKKPFRHELVLEGLVRGREGATSPATFADALSESVREAAGGDSEEFGRIRSSLDAVFGGSSVAPTTVVLRFGLRGWSEPRHKERDTLPHHEVEIQLNGSAVGRAVWNGTDHYIHEVEVSSDIIRTDANELALVVPKRMYAQSGDMVVDVVLLNWIELEYEHTDRVGDEQLRLHLIDTEANRRVRVETDDRGPVGLYLPDGTRLEGNGGIVEIDLAHDISEFSVLRPTAAASPNEIVLDRPSDLTDDQNQADYIMITHRSLRKGADRLADFHRARGLTVEVVDVQDIYDEFNFGVIKPGAIKDFLETAHGVWRSPAPRFVLLIGDASWDFKNTTADDSNYADWTYRPGEVRRFWKNRSTQYTEGAELNHRNLVPTSSYTTTEGHAASDTWFVCFDDGDDLPDLAIGRLPVVDLEELDQVIDKITAYADSSPVGPWRRNLLFIANESRAFQQRSDLVADEYGQRGYVPTKIYPHPSEPANEHHTRRIIDNFDGGLQAVHFIGHGGRYIWRTGPPDLEKNHDLFTLDHLDELAGNQRLPVVLSLTCYSAPFDHPTADSIGEKLMRIPDRGAIAVFAASWRNSPSPIMGTSLLEELTTPGNTIGEAVMRAKRKFRSKTLIQTYNLLGDPAVGVGAPGHTLEIRVEEEADRMDLEIEIQVPVVDGTLLVDWVGEDGAAVRQDRLAVTGRVFNLSLDRSALGEGVALQGVRAYVWDETSRVDGIGWSGLAAEDHDGEAAEVHREPVESSVDGGAENVAATQEVS
jgi:hypothetical protein